MAQDPFDPVSERYVAVATYRRSGREVRTPVWLAETDGKCYLFSAANAGKVKRIRANGRARLAACDFRGNVRGQWTEARGRVMAKSESLDRIYAALQKKYGWRLTIVNFFARLSGRYEKRAMIELDLSARE